jgi:hypothetical protein
MFPIYTEKIMATAATISTAIISTTLAPHITPLQRERLVHILKHLPPKQIYLSAASLRTSPLMSVTIGGWSMATYPHCRRAFLPWLSIPPPAFKDET